MLAADEVASRHSHSMMNNRWWEFPSPSQLKDLFWHTSRGVHESDYLLIEYLTSLNDNDIISHAKDAIIPEFNSVGFRSVNSSPAKGQDARKEARLLETRLLACLFFGVSSDHVERDTEIIALHYSIDVPMPDKFLSTLKELKGDLVLESLGFLGSEGDSDYDIGGKVKNSILWPQVESMLGSNCQTPTTPNNTFNTPVTGNNSPAGIKRRRLSLKTRPPINDERYHFEFDLDRKLTPQSSLPNNKSRTLQPRAKSIITDRTIVLETPIKCQIPSRSSTPGCSQQIRKLSIDDSIEF